MKRATLLSVIGPRTFKLLRNLLTPDKPGDKSYAELVKVLTDHFSPKPSEIMQRSKFYSRSRKPGESISTFVAELRATAEYCNFGTSLNAMIRDRVVCGINEDAIQKRLLAEGDTLTLTKALSLAQAYETAVKDATTLLPSNASPQQIHRVQSAAKAQSKKPCYRCTRTGHSPGACRFRKERCHNCSKIGHIKKACRQADKVGVPSRNVQFVDQTETPTKDEYPLFTLTVSQTTPIVLPVEINHKRVSMELDTGAAVSLVSEETYNQHWAQEQLEESNTRLKTYSG